MADSQDEARSPADPPGGQTPAPGPNDALGDALGEALRQVLSALRHHGRRQVGQLARKGREKLDLYQARRDLERLYQKLGREVVLLIEAGELQHPALAQRAERIRRQEAELLQAEARDAAERARRGEDPAPPPEDPR